jgi:hypothetical protein
MGGIAVGAAGPYWMPALGLGGAGAPGVSAGQLAAIEQTLRDKPGAADILAATDPLRRQLDDTRAELETARQDVADLRVALESLQSVAAAAPETAATGSVDLAPVMSRLETLESTLASTQARVDEAAVAQAAPTQIAEAARQTLEAENRALRDRIDELARSIAETASLAPRIEDVEARLNEVPAQTLRQRRAALIVALGQLQSALTDDGAFAPELRTVQDIAVDDQAMWDRLGPLVEVLAPLAEAGVPTRSQLAAGFPGTAIARSAEADLAGSLIADAPWWKRLRTGCRKGDGAPGGATSKATAARRRPRGSRLPRAISPLPSARSGITQRRRYGRAMAGKWSQIAIDRRRPHSRTVGARSRSRLAGLAETMNAT